MLAEAGALTGFSLCKIAATIAGAAVVAACVASVFVSGKGRWSSLLEKAYFRWLEAGREQVQRLELRRAMGGGGDGGRRKKGKDGRKHNDKYSSRDSTMFTYVGAGRDRMSVELCVSCVETNRLLRNLATDAGLSYDAYEPCSMCKDRIGRIACIQTGAAAPIWSG